MDSIVRVFTAVSPGHTRHEDDVVDRINHRYTVIIIVAFAVVISANVYVGDPIKCWCPAHFHGSHVKYTNVFCWVRNTYFLPYEEHIPHQWEGWKKDEIIYYQWIPFILLGQAMFFYLPRIVWTGLNQKSGVDSDSIMETAQTFQKADTTEHKERTLLLITNQIDRFIGSPRGEKSKGCPSLTSLLCFCCGARFGNYLTFLYLFSKLLFVANVIGQLFLLNTFLGQEWRVYGWDWAMGMYNEHNWSNNSIFPRVTMCDFHMRILGNVQRYTVQCVLPINLYTERMYTFLWFWYVMIAIINIVNFITWILRAVLYTDRKKYIQGHLKVVGRLTNDRETMLSEHFINYYLRQDGVFLLRLIGHNTNGITTNEIIGSLWDLWRARLKSRDPNDKRGQLPTAPPIFLMHPDADDDKVPLKQDDA